MSSYRLDQLFRPRSVALVGVSPRPGSLGRSILDNLRAGGFDGDIDIVSPRHDAIDGQATVHDLASLQRAPDLVVIATPAPTVPELIEAAGARGAAAAIIITAGLGQGPGSLAAATERAARSHGLRLLGPNCLGVVVPHAHLNASFAARLPQAGDLALISQSGAIVAGVVEWAAGRGIGFSALASVGEQLDVDFADLLDYFALDRGTRAILLYIESIKDARKFISAARAAARAKPVIVVKAGRHAAGARAVTTHTGALAGSDAVYDAVFRRTGLLRVYDMDELFEAVQTLGVLRPFPGERLAILTNGGGVGVLAVDRLIDLGGTPATLSPATLERLDAVLPAIWSRGNPVDIIGDADGDRYAHALDALLADRANDAVLVLNVPTTLASPGETAVRVAAVVRQSRSQRYPGKPVFATWFGEHEAAVAAFIGAGIPHYANEADAIGGFMYLTRYAQAQTRLMQTPPALPIDFTPDRAVAERIIDGVLGAGRRWLDPPEAYGLLTAYGVPIAPAVVAVDANAAAQAAAPWLMRGEPVAVKIYSHDILHKSDVDGVCLGLTDAQAVHDAALDILARASALRPDAQLRGVTVHPMVRRRHGRELLAGIADDSTFGPVIVFGHGGVAVEVVADKALALPPLDLALANDLIDRTHIRRLLDGYRNVPAADRAAVAVTLVRLAQMAAELPALRELDINPLIADPSGVIALDARIAVAPASTPARGPRHPRLAIRPYPHGWERTLSFANGRVATARPVRAEDEPLFAPFLTSITREDLRLRFFSAVRDYGHAFTARLTQLDYARAMAFVALNPASGELLGVVRLHSDGDYEHAEFAILVRSDLKGHGLGSALMQLMLEYGRAEGLRRIVGEVLAENHVMLALCRRLGFKIARDPDAADIVHVTYDLI